MIISSPYFLWALGLLSIPIIIHLFQFKRYKKLYFPDISLLKEAKTKSKSQNRLKDLLILFARIAFIAALVFAFSEPIIPADTSTEDIESVSIYLDNSFSMQNEGMNGPLLNEAMQAAFEISESYDANIRLRLITNDFEVKQKRYLSQDEFLDELDDVDISGKHRNIEEVLKFQSSSEDLGKHLFYLISDFKGVSDTTQNTDIVLDSNLDIRVLPLETQYASNVSIDSAWTKEPLFQQGLNQRLFFRITNHGDERIESAPVKISLASAPSQSLMLDIDPETSIDTSIDLEASSLSFISGEISIEDFPITFDNVLHVSLPVISEVNISIIQGDDANAKAIYSVFDEIPFQATSMNESSLDLEKLENSDFIVLNEINRLNSGVISIITDHLDKGKNLLIIPGLNASSALNTSLSESFNINLGKWDTVRQSVIGLNQESKLYSSVFEESNDDIDFPSVQGHWKCSSCDEEKILTLLDGSSLMSSKNFSDGQVFKIASPLNDDFTNLHRHALFVPALINMAIRSQIEQPASYDITTTHLPFYTRSEQARVSLTGDSSYFIPSPSFKGIVVQNRFTEAGIYELMEGDSLSHQFAINFSRVESKVENALTQTIVDLLNDRGFQTSIMDSDMEGLKNEILEADLGVKLWPLFIVIALLFLLAETVLLKVLKG